MCLEALADFPVKKNKRGEVRGWKVFRGNWQKPPKERLAFTIRDTRRPLRRGVWLDANDYGDAALITMMKKHAKRDENAKTYPAGFHLYRTRCEARAWLMFMAMRYRKLFCVLPVRVRNVCATGLQYRARVIVAREMLIERPRNGRKK